MKVAVLMGSANDQPKMAPAVEMLGEFGVACEEHVMSAHRTPAKVAAFASGARDKGFAAIICGAGMAAHLGGAVAAQTTLPVVGVPLSGGALNGVDALYATVQMPRGIPVATVAIDGAANAAILVVEMLAITDTALADRLREFLRQVGRPVIGRYSLPEMAGLFTDEARFATWLEVEVLATEAWASLGVVPAEDAAAVRARQPVVDAALVEAIAAREAVTDHDVAAFVDIIQDRIGPPAGNWVHYGLTSSDVVDTALCVTLTRAADVLLDALDTLVAALAARAREFAATPIVGRTHGIHAEPTTFGAKVALWCLQADRDRQRLRAARDAVAVGKLSGAVGTYSNVDPAVEAMVCRNLGLVPVPATQVVARDRHAQYLYACASIGATLELIGTEVRHLQRTEVGEASEPFAAGQKGSSAMPHKRNPIKSEQLSGLARVLRGYLGAGLEDVALWHERDISHSSVERIVLADASILTHYMVVRAHRLVAGLVVDTGRMLENFDLSYGLVFSQPVLLALVAGGMTRDDAYRVVQRDAMQAWGERRPFRTVLEEDPDVKLKPEALDEAFDLERALRHAHRTIDALDGVA